MDLRSRNRSEPGPLRPGGLLRSQGSGPTAASDRLEVCNQVAATLRAGLSGEARSIRIYLPEDPGGLRPAVTEGPEDRHLPLLASAQTVFSTGRSLQERPLNGGGVTTAMPLLSGGSVTGAMAVVTERSWAAEDWSFAESVLGLAALALAGLEKRFDQENEIRLLSEGAALARRVITAGSPEAAAEKIAGFWHDACEAPVAIWLTKSGEGKLFLAASCVGQDILQTLREEMWTIPRLDSSDAETGTAIRKRFAAITGTDEVTLTNGGDAVILLGRSARDLRSLEVLQPLLLQALSPVIGRTVEERERERLDLGWGWTAHELRGPLTGTKLMIEVLLQSAGESDPNKTLLKQACSDITHLIDLCDGVLRWTVGREPLDPTPTDLASLVHEAARSVASELGASHRLRIEPGKQLLVPADPKHLRGAISNLVRNALLYSPDEKDVVVRALERGSVAIVEVEDRGPGIPETEQHRIFEPFVRGGAGKSRPSGKGLGLFITQRIVEAHGGKISLSSGPQGSTFQLHLPITKEIDSVDGRATAPRPRMIVLSDPVAAQHIGQDV